jgi:hypothetical protein
MKLIVLLVVLALRRVEIAWPMFLREPNSLRQSLLTLAPRGSSDGVAWLLVVLLPALGDGVVARLFVGPARVDCRRRIAALVARY